MPPIPAENLSILQPLHREMVQALAAATCQHYGISYHDLMWQRSHAFSARRQVFFYLVLESTGLSSYAVAPVFERGHNGITQAAEIADAQKTVYPQVRDAINAIITIANATEKKCNWQVATAAPTSRKAC